MFGGLVRWIMDTGAGHDMVSAEDISPHMRTAIRDTEDPVYFRTANGVCSTSKHVEVHCSALGQPLHPLIVKDTPPLWSVGYRCMHQGWTSVWPSYQ